jgi:hypothetical protein
MKKMKSEKFNFSFFSHLFRFEKIITNWENFSDSNGKNINEFGPLNQKFYPKKTQKSFVFVF